MKRADELIEAAARLLKIEDERVFFFSRRPEHVQTRDAVVFILRQAGFSFPEIASHMRRKGHSGIHEMNNRAKARFGLTDESELD